VKSYPHPITKTKSNPNPNANPNSNPIHPNNPTDSNCNSKMIKLASF